MTAPRQTSFAGGEWSSSFWGRDDISRYRSAVRRMRNAFPLPEGGAQNRPGSIFCHGRAGLDHTKVARLLPFVYAELAGQAYSLEFGDGYIRFVAQGGYVAPDPTQYDAWAAPTWYALGAWVTKNGVAYRSLQGANNNHDPEVSPTWWEASTIYEIVSPYAVADLALLQYSQSGDLITLTRHGYAPKELRRYAHAKWTLSDAVFGASASGLLTRSIATMDTGQLSVNPAMNADGFCALEYDFDKVVTGNVEIIHYAVARVYRDADGFEHETLSFPFLRNARIRDTTYPGWDGGTAYAGGTRVTGPDGAAYECWVGNTGHDPSDGDMYDASGIGLGPFALYWTPLCVGHVFGTAIPAGIGASYEGPGVRLAPAEHLPKLTWKFPALAAGLTQVSTRIYRGTSPAYGFMEELPGSSLTGEWVDDGTIDPDYADAPRTGDNPFSSARPACVTGMERRRIFGNLANGATPYRPATSFASAIEDWGNFDKPLVKTDDDSVELTLVGRRRVEIRWLLGTIRLLAGTSSGVWALMGGGEGPLTPLSMDTKLQSEDGVAWLPPIIAGDQVLFARSRGGVSEISYEDTRRKFLAKNLSLFARHFFRGHTIVDWTFQVNPAPIIWAVRDDGALLSLTYDKDVDAWGWALHELAGGSVESICAVPEGDEDTVYMIVNRTEPGAPKRYLERLASRTVDENDFTTWRFLDASLLCDGRNATGTTMRVAQMAGPPGGPAPYEPGAPVSVLSSSAPMFGAGDVGHELVIDPDGARVRVLLTELLGPDTMAGEMIGALPAEFQAVPTTEWALAKDTFSGLDHLEGQTVVALVDGDVVRVGADGNPLVVTGGEITIEQRGAVVLVGLPYRSYMELLDLADGPDARRRVKTVKKVTIEIEKSRGVCAGTSLEKPLAQANQRTPAHGYGPIPLSDDRIELIMPDSYTKTGRAVIVQDEPLPMTVTAVQREVEYGGA